MLKTIVQVNMLVLLYSQRGGRSPDGFWVRCIFLIEHRNCRLIPYVPTETALRFVNTDNLTTLTASPSLVLIFHELTNAGLVDALKILDHAHPVLCSITG